MSDLIARILEEIQKTEDCARLVQEGRREWHIGEVAYEGYLVMDSKGARVVFSKQLGVDYHIARNDPSSVLRRCTEDRKTVLAFKGMDEAKRDGLIGDIDEGKWIGLHIAVSGIARSYGITEEEK